MNENLYREEGEPVQNGRPPHLSFNRVNRYLHCPEQYRLYYVERLRPRQPSASLVFGSIVHQGQAGLFAKQIDPVKTFDAAWNVLKSAPLAYKAKESWQTLKDRGEALLEKFLKCELPRIGAVTAVEEEFRLGISNCDMPLVGIIDLAASFDGKRAVIDFKTSGSSYDPADAHLSDQLTAYMLAKPEVEILAFCVLVKTKEPKIEWHATKRTGSQLAEYLHKAGYVAGEIGRQNFYKRPGKWCAWCDFRAVCLGDNQKAKETLTTVP